GTLGLRPSGSLASTAAHVRGATGRFEETALLQQALEHSVSRFRFDCAHARHAADAEQYLNEQNREVAFRRLELTPCCQGASVTLRGQLDPVAGATLRPALEHLARKDGPDDERSRERRLADALVELVSHCLDDGQIPRVQGQRLHLQVTT